VTPFTNIFLNAGFKGLGHFVEATGPRLIRRSPAQAKTLSRFYFFLGVCLKDV